MQWSNEHNWSRSKLLTSRQVSQQSIDHQFTWRTLTVKILHKAREQANERNTITTSPPPSSEIICDVLSLVMCVLFFCLFVRNTMTKSLELSSWKTFRTEGLMVLWPRRVKLMVLCRVTTLQTMWNALAIPWRFVAILRGTRHVKCYSYHACTSVTVSVVGLRMQQCMIGNHIFNI